MVLIGKKTVLLVLEVLLSPLLQESTHALVRGPAARGGALRRQAFWLQPKTLKSTEFISGDLCEIKGVPSRRLRRVGPGMGAFLEKRAEKHFQNK